MLRAFCGIVRDCFLNQMHKQSRIVLSVWLQKKNVIIEVKFRSGKIARKKSTGLTGRRLQLPASRRTKSMKIFEYFVCFFPPVVNHK
jgi:hypothetical protein